MMCKIAVVAYELLAYG